MADEAQEAHSDDGSPNRADVNDQQHADQGTGAAGIDAIDDIDSYLAAAETAGNMPPDPDDADDGEPVDIDALPDEDEHDFPELAKDEDSDEDSPADPIEDEGGEDDGGEEGSDDGGTNKDGAKPPQFRFRPKNDLEEKAFWYMRRNADLSLEEAVARAKADLAPADQDQGDNDGGEQDDSTPQTRDELEDAIRSLREEKRNALAEFDYDRVAEIEGQLDGLIDLREPLREREAARQQEATETFRRDLEQVNQAYPDATNPDSEFYQRMREYDSHLRETDNPLFYDPGKASKIARRVAAELGVLPVLPRKSVPSSKPATQASPRRQAAPRPASGSARTSGGPSAMETQIDTINDPEDFMEFVGAGY